MHYFLKNITLLLCICVLLSWYNTYASINYEVTPIKYELSLQPGESITLPAAIRNRSSDTVTLPTTASDFQSSGANWVPSFVRRSELVFPDQQLSTWITIEKPSVTIAPGQEESTSFTINVPITATPGGHYGAIFFKNDDSETSSTGNIWIDVDYGIIILVNVEWEVVVDVDIGEPIISIWWWSWGWSWGSTSQNAPRENIPEQENNTNTPENSQTPETNIPENITPTDTNTPWAWYTWDDNTWNPIYIYPDSCPLWDFTTSKYDNKCFSFDFNDAQSNNTKTTPWQEPIVSWNSNENSSTQDDEITNIEPPLFSDDFNVNFSFPINNKGNTHIKPKGKITLKDENGKVIKAIGKETISNDRWAIIWEEIVDYIPINDQDGNVLPQTTRIFETNWEGFPFKTFDDEGNQVVNYWSPWEYYTAKNKEDAGFLMFWERVSESRTYKTISAEIELIYLDENGEEIEFNTAKEFPVQYIEQKVTLNPYVILALLLLSTAWLMLLWVWKWWLIAIKTSPCWNCSEKIKSSWSTCPHCTSMQNKRKQKAFEEKKKQAATTPTKPRAKALSKPSTTKTKTPVKKKTTKKKSATATKVTPKK